MEPTKELSAKEYLVPSPAAPPPPSVTMDTDFCDSLLNPVPGATCQESPVSTFTETDMSDDCYLGNVMPDFSSVDFDSLDLECFLADPVPLAC